MSNANGPTLNQEYNNLLISWAREGCCSKPECEECECDLTGKEVFEPKSYWDTVAGWICSDCNQKFRDEFDDTDSCPDEYYDNYGDTVRDREREDFHSDG